MITLNLHIKVKSGTRDELIEAGRVLFDELAKEPTFLDAWIHSTADDHDLIVIYERWKETKESFMRDILPKEFYKPYFAVLDRLGIERKAYWLDTRHAWRS
jgi:Antibiotic biosynthesis monooxygenase